MECNLRRPKRIKLGLKLKQIVCKHNFQAFANIQSHATIYKHKVKTVLVCSKCGKLKFIHQYLPTKVDFNKLLEYVHMLDLGMSVDAKYAKLLKATMIKTDVSIFE